MPKAPLKHFLIAQALVFSVCFVSGIATKSSTLSWYPTLVKSPLNPPPITFPIVWTLLYFMIGLSMWQILENAKKNHVLYTLRFFLVQLGLNFLWSPAFFGLQSPLLGLIIIIPLVAMIFQNIVFYRKISQAASWFLVPYFLWCCFALYLNLFIFLNN